MPMNNTANVGQSNASAFEVGSTVKTLEHAKKFMRIAAVESDAIVANVYDILRCRGLGADFDAGGFSSARVF